MSVACIGHKYHRHTHCERAETETFSKLIYKRNKKKIRTVAQANILNSIQIVSVYVYDIAFISTTFGIVRSVRLAVELKGQ